MCIALVREGKFAGALAVEPAQNTFRHLVKNVARNGLGGAIRCVNVAVSATNAALIARPAKALAMCGPSVRRMH